MRHTIQKTVEKLRNHPLEMHFQVWETVEDDKAEESTV